MHISFVSRAIKIFLNSISQSKRKKKQPLRFLMMTLHMQQWVANLNRQVTAEQGPDPREVIPVKSIGSRLQNIGINFLPNWLAHLRARCTSMVIKYM